MSSLHRAALIVAGFVSTSALVAACAASDDETAPPSSDDGGGVPDSGGPGIDDAGRTPDADATAPEINRCTEAGWCSVEVDPRLTFDDLWPVDGAVIAIASRNKRSTVLFHESDTLDSPWKVIHEVPFVFQSVWATNTDVWVAGGDPGYVAHGRLEGDAWKWQPRPIAVEAPVTAIWGTGEGEVYALADTRVWRLEGDGDWAVDFGGAASAEGTTLANLTGTSKDDVWVTGARGEFPWCSVVAHKTGGTWVTLLDGKPEMSPEWDPVCTPIPGAVPMMANVGIATPTAPRELVAWTTGTFRQSFVRIRHLENGGVDIATSELPDDLYNAKDRSSIWGASASDLYVAGFSKVNRGQDIWADGGTWNISSVAFEGIALVKPFHVVRGTKSDDVWLAGESYVFHKTSR